MSFLKKWFGGSGGKSEPEPVAEQTHEGYTLRAAPMPEGGQFRLAGSIFKEIDGELKEHKLIRADILPSKEDAANVFMLKAKQMIKEQGERIFS